MGRYFILYEYTMLRPSDPAGQKSLIAELATVDMDTVTKVCQAHLENHYKHSAYHKMGDGFYHLRVYTILNIQKL